MASEDFNVTTRRVQEIIDSVRVPPSSINVDLGGVLHTYYVRPNGSDTSGDGSLVRPFASLNHALKNVVPYSFYNGRIRIDITGCTITDDVAFPQFNSTVRLETNPVQDAPVTGRSALTAALEIWSDLVVEETVLFDQMDIPTYNGIPSNFISLSCSGNTWVENELQGKFLAGRGVNYNQNYSFQPICENGVSSLFLIGKLGTYALVEGGLDQYIVSTGAEIRGYMDVDVDASILFHGINFYGDFKLSLKKGIHICNCSMNDGTGGKEIINSEEVIITCTTTTGNRRIDISGCGHVDITVSATCENDFYYFFDDNVQVDVGGCYGFSIPIVFAWPFSDRKQRTILTCSVFYIPEEWWGRHEILNDSFFSNVRMNGNVFRVEFPDTYVEFVNVSTAFDNGDPPGDAAVDLWGPRSSMYISCDSNFFKGAGGGDPDIIIEDTEYVYGVDIIPPTSINIKRIDPTGMLSSAFGGLA